MDDWTYAHADAEVPDTQPPLLHEDGRGMETLAPAHSRQKPPASPNSSRPMPGTASGTPPRQTSRCRSRRRPASR